MPLIANYRKTRNTQMRGTRAAQPAAGDVLQGTIYYVTDEFTTERSDGASNWQSWDDYNSSGGVYYFGGLTTSFPSFVRTTTDINIRLADNSAYTDIEGAQIRANGAINDSGLGFMNTVQSDSFSANFLCRRARDNAGAVEALQSGDFIAAFVCQGHDGTAYGPTNNGALIFAATENYTTTTKGTAIILATTTTGTTTRVNRWQVGGTGHLESINGTEMIKWGTTSSFPALKRSSAVLQVRLGDDSAFTDIQADDIITNNTTVMHRTTGTLADGAGAGAGTLTNAPTAGDPTKWVAIDDNGTTRYIPTWT